jgi:excinuclease ABC subunit C
MNEKLQDKLKELPRVPGVYLYRNLSGKVIYVGKAVNLKNRVSSYFQNKDLDPKTTELVKHIVGLEWIEVGSEFEALVLEADLIKRYKPKYNIRLRDDKNYVYLKITKEDYPRITVVHQITDHEAEYLGPFTDSGAIRTILKLGRKIFPFCTCSLPADEICLYYHIGLCPGHGPKYISARDYQKNINGLRKLFSGKVRPLRSEFTIKMKAAARDHKFEEAAKYRDNIKYLSRIERSHIISERDLSADAGLAQVANALEMDDLPQKIECFDISNVMGTAATGSMVVFRNGISSPKDYRRFQIKTVKGANDFAMMAEVLRRRFSLGETKRKDKAFSDLPDLVILDGGKGQLSAVAKNVQLPEGVKLVSLAKRFDHLFQIKKGSFNEVILKEDSEGKYLIQRVRDEAHRFAVSYHHKIKGKALFETSLDAIPGVGPKTKKKLLREFGSMKKIKEASSEELASVVGPSVAQKIKENL